MQKSVVSPSAKARSSKGFAAPRKKEEIMQANMKECKICNRKFADDKIERHEKLCFDNKERQKKSEKRISEPNIEPSVIAESIVS